MINISFTPYALTQHPLLSTVPQNAFALQLGPVSNVLIPRPGSISPGDPLRNGSAFQIDLRLGETFELEDVIFEILVDNAKAGGDVSFLNRLLQYVNSNILQVQQDNQAPLTSEQILAYTAP